MSSALAEHCYTPEEYLAMEREAEGKNEYFNGVIYAMSGASRRHNLIGGNIFGEIRNQLKGRPCESYMGDMRVKVSPTGLYTYPDVVIVCGEPRLEDAHFDTLLNPTVLIEVLSPSTSAYDHSAKFAHYRRLESLREYVLIEQDVLLVEHYTLQGELWTLRDYRERRDILRLESIGCEVPLREIYDRILFAVQDPSARPPRPND